MPEDLSKIAIFRNKQIRRVVYGGEWWFVINDVIKALTDSVDPAQYVKRMRARDPEFSKLFSGAASVEGAVQIVPPLRLTVETDGGPQKLYCWYTEGIFRLGQSIPSPKAEPFKRWLARVGFERIQEIENPELILRRHRLTYKMKGYDDDWINQRTSGMRTRDELTDEWDKHGIETDLEYSILTAEISRATFGLAPSEYKELKGLERENLRDHMDALELLFTELGEVSTTEITRANNPQGLTENQATARSGGSIARGAREQLERATGRKVVSKKNYLKKPQSRKEIEK
jgi:hypothetical protein